MSTPEKVFLTLHVLGNRWFIYSFKTDKKTFAAEYWYKKYFFVTKRFHLVTARLSKDQRNKIIGVLMAVNDIAHHFGCSRQTIHYLMNRYNKTGYVRVRARPGRARVTTLRPYRVDALAHPRNRFKRQPLLLVFTGFMHKR